MCKTESRVRFEADSAIIVRMSVMWAWQWHKGIFLVNYWDLVPCDSERGIHRDTGSNFQLWMQHI